MAGFCCGVAIGAILLAVALVVGGHIVIERADGRLAWL